MVATARSSSLSNRVMRSSSRRSSGSLSPTKASSSSVRRTQILELPGQPAKARLQLPAIDRLTEHAS